MKKYFYLIVIVLIFGLVLAGCSLLSNVGQVPTNEQSGIVSITKGTTYIPEEFDLFAGQNIYVGKVNVWNDGTSLYVEYEITEEGWVLNETHLAVVTDIIDFPTNRAGNPKVGHFPHQREYDLIDGVKVDTYTILNPWSVDQELYIAAHAVVVRPLDDCYEEVWQIGEVETDGCSGNLTNYANEFNWKKLDLSGGYTLPVEDCEQGPGLNSNKPLFTTPFIVGTSFDEFPYNSNYKKSYAADFDVEWNESLSFGGSLTISWSPPNAQTYTKVISGSGIPSPEIITVLGYQAAGSGWYMDLYPLVSNSVEIDPLPDGLHTINLEQTEGGGTFWDWVRLEKPCEQEETAWGDGVRFTHKGNWATYFEYIVQPLTVDLVEKNTTTWEIIEDGASGTLIYLAENPSVFLADLTVKDLVANSWYLLTLQGYSDSTTGSLLGLVGYYGVETKPAWADVALFQTDGNGDANLTIPAAFPAGIFDPVHGWLGAPVLPDGTYTGVTVVVKFINTGLTPDWGVMIWGGTGFLFEYAPMETFTVGS